MGMSRMPLDEKLMVKLYKVGKTSTEIATKLKCSAQVVCERLKENGVQIRSKMLPLDEKLIVKLYNDGKTSTEIAARFKCSPQVVCKRLKESGVQIIKGEKNRTQFSEKTIAKIVRWYQIDRKMIQWIARQCNCSVYTIRHLLDRVGVKRHGTNRKYFFSQDYFKEIDTPNKAYWLGLFYTDGNVSDTVFSLGLQRRDKHILKRLAKEVGYTGEITDYVETKAIKGGP